MRKDSGRKSKDSGGVKRAADCLCALTALAFFLPWMVLFAVLIRIDSRGPVFYFQERIGKDGVPFRLMKFRSMVDRAEERGHWATAGASDPRITRVGRFLRRTSLDEMPQLWNVLRGEMSLVGPRPDLRVQTARYPEEMKERLSVKPGLTGLAQALGRSVLTPSERDRLDLEYVRTGSLRLDFMILLWTLRGMFSGKGTN